MRLKTTFRPITPGDDEFLYQVYASTRADELALVDWDDAEKHSFLKMQFAAQHTFYQQQFTQAEFHIVELNGEPIGRLYLDYRADEIRIIDIAILPAYRNRGIGTQLLMDVLAEGDRRQHPVRIHVERYNPALRLYDRLGFRAIGDNGVYLLMEWLPN